MIGMGVGNWYRGGEMQQSLDGYIGSADMQAAVDWYYDLGALVNLYGHSGNGQYVAYLAGKPNLWKTNAVGVRDWVLKRDPIKVTPALHAERIDVGCDCYRHRGHRPSDRDRDRHPQLGRPDDNRRQRPPGRRTGAGRQLADDRVRRQGSGRHDDIRCRGQVQPDRELDADKLVRGRWPGHLVRLDQVPDRNERQHERRGPGVPEPVVGW